ncbi:MAG: ABC transporter permease [Desulfovermiculus sp.]|nr:ABC transporter permease [Desulfovermiculus sp.]
MQGISSKYTLLSYILAGLALLYLSYLLPGLMPGDFVTAMYSSSEVSLSSEQEKALLAEYVQQEGFGQYVLDFLRLDWGYSYAYQAQVTTLIFQALPWTLVLMGSAHLLSILAGFVAGVEAAWRRGGQAEKLSVGSMTVLQGVPELGTGVVLLLVFSLLLGWFPAAGGETAYAELSPGGLLVDRMRHLALPLTTLFLAYFPGNFLLARGSMVLVLKEQYLETARAKGLPPLRVRYVHAARNALIPVLTRLGLRIAFMVTGVLVVETIFSYPGLGTLLFEAISNRDLPLVQGVVLFSALAVLCVNLLLEAVYIRLDPRVKYAY